MTYKCPDTDFKAKHAEAAKVIMEPLTAAVIPVYPSKVTITNLILDF